MITRRGAMAVVLSEDRKSVLLLRREIFWLWDLPGGGIETGEEPAAAAVRETCEETGYQVEIERPVGTYLHASVYGRGEQLTHAFLAHVTGGRPVRFGPETSALEWVPLGALPGLEVLQRQIVADAVSNFPDPVERTVVFPTWKLIPARILFTFMRWRNWVFRTLLRAARRTFKRY